MWYILLGAVAIAELYLYEAALLSRRPLLRYPIAVLGAGGFLVSAVMVAATSEGYSLGTGVRILGAVCAFVFLALLIYSLFIEISPTASELTTTGTYALVRHPGVLWFALLLLSVFLLTGSRLLLIAVPVWVGMDILYIIVQERWFFPRMFGSAYTDYQRKVPMLIPTGTSIRECLRTVGSKRRGE